MLAVRGLLVAHPRDTPDTPHSPDTPDTLEALDTLVAELDARTDQLRAGFGEVFARFDHPRTRRTLDALLDDLRG